MSDEGDILPMAATLMPDHTHFLFVLRERLRIGAVVGKFKALSKTVLEAAGAAWQANFYEHRLRPHDMANSFAHYMFMNPYRAGLLPRKACWPHWWLEDGVDFDFMSLLEDGRYPPETWMNWTLDAFHLSADMVGEEW